MFGVRAPEELHRLSFFPFLFLFDIRFPPATEPAAAMIAVVLHPIPGKGMLDDSAVFFIAERFFIANPVHPIQVVMPAEYNGIAVRRDVGPVGLALGFLVAGQLSERTVD